MSRLYTVNGFPTRNDAPPTEGAEARYHDISIDDLYANGGPSSSISFPDELAILETVIKAWIASGNMFSNLLQPGVVVSPSVTSFVVESAMMATGQKTRRGMSFQDWALLLKPSDETRCGNVMLDKEAVELLTMLAGTPSGDLFQKWVLNAGFEDLVGAMKIYVGDIAVS